MSNKTFFCCVKILNMIIYFKKAYNKFGGITLEKESLNNNEETSKKERAGRVQVEKKKGVNKGLIITAIILSVIAIIIVVFALVNKINTNVYTNVYLSDVNIGGKTEELASKEVDKLIEKFNKKTVTIKYNEEIIMELSPSSIDMAIDKDATMEKVMTFGRSGNVVTNNIAVLKAMFAKEVIEPVYTYSEPKLTNISTEITGGIEGKVKDDSYVIDYDNYNLVITKGTAGKDIIVSDFKADVLNILKANNIEEYSIELEERQPKELDIDVVYAEVFREAKDAYADKTVDPVVYHRDEMGISFDKEELRKVLEKEENKIQGKVITFKLITKKPKVTLADITKGSYVDKLGSFTSSYITSDANRASNVALGASMLNGTIVMPGETFSFNNTMGDCGLSSRGFKLAAVFKAGKVAQEIGGGICQVSSTLYNAVLYANLEIVSRSNHALPVGYVPVSLDATVYYPYLDFKFKNTRTYPIKIVATTTSSRKLTISIMGTKEDKEYDVELTSWVVESVPSKVQTQKDSSLKAGKTKVIQVGSNGYKSVAYKTVKYNGKVISKTLLSKDTYGSTPRIIAVGTKKTGKSVKVYKE